jgi:GNAT superfamily N-acetyltransferase
MSNPDFQIVKVHPHLISFVDGLQRKNAEALSFYPKCVFERESENGRIFLGMLNGEPCGYLYVGAQGADVKCHQVCIEYDARRRLYGAALVAAMEEYAEGACTLTLRCGFDLDANTFWAEMGYQCIGVQDGGIRRMRKINVWRKAMQIELFADASVVPAVGKTDASVWRKNKQTGLVTQFIRGKRMRDYRALIVGGGGAEQVANVIERESESGAGSQNGEHSNTPTPRP